MAIIKILVILFLAALAALGLQVIFSKKQRTGKNSGGGVTAHKDLKPEKQKNDENN